jgi:D-alanyl-D-alanine carboxypeptidase
MKAVPAASELNPAPTIPVRPAGRKPVAVAYIKTPAVASAHQREKRPRGGWLIQVGAFPDEGEAKEQLTYAQSKISRILREADPFTEPVVKGDKTLYRARFAGLEKDQAQAACRTLKKNDIACMALKN